MASAWSNSEVETLIAYYQAHRNLWMIKDPRYYNKALRARCLNELVNELGNKYTAEDIKSKFHNLRSTFTKNHKEYSQQMKSGAGLDDIAEPGWCFYQSLLFLRDLPDPATSISNLDSREEDILDSEPEDTSDNEADGDSEKREAIEGIELSPGSTTRSKPEPRTNTETSKSVVTPKARSGRKRKPPSPSEPTLKDKFLASAIEAFNEPTVVKDRYDNFGEFVASTLREIAQNSKFNADMAMIDLQRDLISHSYKSQPLNPQIQVSSLQQTAGPSTGLNSPFAHSQPVSAFRLAFPPAPIGGITTLPQASDYQLTTLTPVSPPTITSVTDYSRL